MTTLSRRAALTACVAALVLTLAGCWTGQNAYTSPQQPSGDGGFATVGKIQVRQTVLVQTNPVTGADTLSISLANDGASDDVLQALVVGDGTATTSLPTAGLNLPAGGATSLSWNGAPSVGVYGLKAGLSTFVRVTLVFRDAGTTAVQALVVPATGYYAGITAAPATKP